MSSSAARGLPFELRMAWRYLATRHREGPVALVTLLCTAGVVVGVMALVLGLALMDGVHGSVRRALVGSNPHVRILPATARGYAMDESAVVTAAARGAGGVESVSPYTSQHGLLMSELLPSGLPIELKGIDPASEPSAGGIRAAATTMGWSRLAADDVPVAAPAADEDAPLTAAELAPPPPPVVLLGERLAQRLGVVPGETVHLVTGEVRLTAVGLIDRRRALTVGGLLRTGMASFDEVFAVGNLRRLAADPRAPSVDGLSVVLADPMRAPEVARELRALLPGDHEVRDWTDDFSPLLAAFKWEKLLLVLAVGLIGVVAGFNIFTILTLNVTARVADIGILSAIGASPATITRIFLWMGLLLGGVGTLLGLAAGAGLATLLDRLGVIRLDATVYLVEHVPFRVEPLDLLVVGAGMLLVSFVATVVPARSAARLDPVVALRNA